MTSLNLPSITLFLPSILFVSCVLKLLFSSIVVGPCLENGESTYRKGELILRSDGNGCNVDGIILGKIVDMVGIYGSLGISSSRSVDTLLTVATTSFGRIAIDGAEGSILTSGFGIIEF